MLSFAAHQDANLQALQASKARGLAAMAEAFESLRQPSPPYQLSASVQKRPIRSPTAGDLALHGCRQVLHTP